MVRIFMNQTLPLLRFASPAWYRNYIQYALLSCARVWLKWLILVGIQKRIIIVQKITPTNSLRFPLFTMFCYSTLKQKRIQNGTIWGSLFSNKSLFKNIRLLDYFLKPLNASCLTFEMIVTMRIIGAGVHIILKFEFLFQNK